MAKWEYRLTRDRVEPREPVIECDRKGICIVHEPSEGELLQILNREGEDGWELVELGYHQGEIVGVWKREKEG